MVGGEELREIGLVDFRGQPETHGGFGRVRHEQSCVNREGQHGTTGAVAGANDARGFATGKFAADQCFAQKKKDAISVVAKSLNLPKNQVYALAIPERTP